MSIYHQSAKHEFPFAPDGQAHSLDGYEAIALFMESLLKHIEYGPIDELKTCRTDDGVLVEGLDRHRRAADGEPVDIRFIWHITLVEGKVSIFRDYMDSGQLARLA